ncbi:MAG TPA: ribbon-helix-helix protein, CopG family [Vicinamibacterales bacterium]|nr:ribbon-helix-helix protein, CopG family [Vicinamibacterales bacterium]
MIRTQISLDAEEYELAKDAADKLGISVAEFVRRAIRRELPVADTDKPWMRYAGFVESGDSRASERIDEVVYGTKD